MSVTIEAGTMAKAKAGEKAGKGRPKQATGEGTAVRLDSDIAGMAKYLAAAKGTTMTRLLSDYLRPFIEKEFKKAGERLGGETK